MNAIEMLKEDHQRVDQLFKKVKSTPKSEHPPLFAQIKAELEVHAHIEEVAFYPALISKGDQELEDITREGIEEHHQAKIFLAELSKLKPANKQYEAKLTVLMEDIEHHVEEEEGDMFKMVDDQFSEEAQEKLGVALERARGRFVQTMTPAQRSALAKSLAAAGKPGMIESVLEKAKDVVSGLVEGDNGKSKKGSGAAKKASTKATAKSATTTATKSSTPRKAAKTSAKTASAGSRKK